MLGCEQKLSGQAQRATKISGWIGQGVGGTWDCICELEFFFAESF